MMNFSIVLLILQTLTIVYSDDVTQDSRLASLNSTDDESFNDKSEFDIAHEEFDSKHFSDQFRSEFDEEIIDKNISKVHVNEEIPARKSLDDDGSLKEKKKILSTLVIASSIPLSNGNESRNVSITTIPIFNGSHFDTENRVKNISSIVTSWFQSYVGTVLSSIYKPFLEVIVFKNISKKNEESADNVSSIINDNQPEDRIDSLLNETSSPPWNNSGNSTFEDIAAKLDEETTTLPSDLLTTDVYSSFDESNYHEISDLEEETMTSRDLLSANITERFEDMTTALYTTTKHTWTPEINTTVASVAETTTDLKILRSIDQQTITEHSIGNFSAQGNGSLQNNSLSRFINILSRNYNDSNRRLPFSSRYSQKNSSTTERPEVTPEEDPITVKDEGPKKLEKREIPFESEYNSNKRQDLASYFHNGNRIRESYLNLAKAIDQDVPQKEISIDELDERGEVDPYAVQEMFLRNQEDITMNAPAEESQTTAQNVPTDVNESSVMYLIDSLDYSLLDDTDKTLVSTEANVERKVRPLRNQKQFIQRESKNSKRTITRKNIDSKRNKKSNVREKKKKKKKKNEKSRPAKASKKLRKKETNRKKHHSDSSKNRGKLKRRNSNIQMLKKKRRTLISTLNLPSEKPKIKRSRTKPSTKLHSNKNHQL